MLLYQNLVKSPGWEQLAKYVQDQIDQRRNQLELTPHTELGGVLMDQYLKGEIAGLRLFLSIPDTVIQESKAIIDALKEKIDEHTEPDTDDLFDGSRAFSP